MDHDLVILNPDMPLEEAWQLLQQNRKPLMLVMADRALSGVVDDENMAEFILIQTASRKNTS
jgi:CBS domain-containing protein